MSTPCPRCGAAFAPPGPCPACHLRAALEKPAAPDLEGVQLGRYLVGKRIGAGGMGWVYEAFDTHLEVPVALKILAEDLDERAALLQEARLTASLRHENIVRVLEVGEHEGISFFTMDRIDGGPLATPIADPKRAATVVRDIARAVGHAHRQGILHRDLKPQNVLLDTSGRVFVTDFGLAARFDRAAGATLATGGTPQYMAPEVLRGEPGAVSTLADVWALGAILYELLAGRPPFEASSIEELAVKLAEPPPPLARVPLDLAAVCFKCLEKDPARRHESADALADELQCFLEDRPVPARPRDPVERAVRFVACHPFSVALAGLLACAVVYVVVAALSLAHAQRTAYHAADFAARRAADVIAIQIERLSALVEEGARDPQVVRAARGVPGEEPGRACEELFARYAGTPIDGWYMYDRQGISLGHAPGTKLRHYGWSYAFRDYFRGAAQRAGERRRTAYVSRAFQSESDGAYTVALSAPVYDEAGAWVGVLVVSLPTGAALATLEDVGDDRLSAAVIAPRDRERNQDARDADPIFLLHRALRAPGERLPARAGAPPDTSALVRRAPVRGTPFVVVVSFPYDSALGARLGRLERVVVWVPAAGLAALVWAFARHAHRRRRETPGA